MEAMRRAHGLPTRFEADGEGSYGRSVELIQERQGYATAEEFARAMGVSRRTVEGWKAGKKPSGMALKMLRQLAEDKPGEATTVAVTGPLPANARPGGVATDIFERLSEECQ